MTAWMKSLAQWVGVVALLALPASAQQAPGTGKSLPVGWYVTESAPQLYEASVDTSAPCEGARSASLRSRTDNPNGYGTFMQAFGAQDYRGKRLRFSAAVRARDVKGWAGLWMRVESSDPKQPLGFDNMQSRALVGSVGCQRYDVVLDVPREATYITAGLLLSGTGNAWLDGVRFEVVGPEVAVTDLLSSQTPSAGKPVALESQATASAPPRGQLPLGRVGFVWFNRDRVQIQQQRPEPRNRTYERQANGVWKNAFKEELTESPGEVKGEFEQRSLHLKLKSLPGPETRIEGTWGDHDVRIVLGVDKISMKWGFYERQLVRDPEPPDDDPSCIRYKRVEGARHTDVLDVCGAALSKNPPVAQLAVAFLANGFRRMPPVDALPPVPSKPPERLDRDAMSGGQPTTNSNPP
jgi:hypothetical protein